MLFDDFWGENRSEIWKFHGHEVHGSGLRLGAIGLVLIICDCWNGLPFGLVPSTWFTCVAEVLLLLLLKQSS